MSSIWHQFPLWLKFSHFSPSRRKFCFLHPQRNLYGMQRCQTRQQCASHWKTYSWQDISPGPGRFPVLSILLFWLRCGYQPFLSTFRYIPFVIGFLEIPTPANTSQGEMPIRGRASHKLPPTSAGAWRGQLRVKPSARKLEMYPWTSSLLSRARVGPMPRVHRIDRAYPGPNRTISGFERENISWGYAEFSHHLGARAVTGRLAT